MVQLSHLVHDYWENHICNRIALSYVLAEQGANWAVANTTYCTKINISGDTEIQLHSLTELGTWLKKVTLSQSLSLTYFILIGLGLRDHGSEVLSSIGNFPAYKNHNNLHGALSSLKGFTCMFAVAKYQANDLRSEFLKRNKKDNQLEICELKVVDRKYNRD